MDDTTTANYTLGYCTNVHAGEDLERYLASLEKYSVDVKSRMPGDRPLAIGLWLSAQTAQQILTEDRLDEFEAFLESSGLRPFTMNGFPYGNFHADTVKYQVYKPDWTEPERLGYTANLIKIMTRLMPEQSQAGISTLPLGWPGSDFNYSSAAKNLVRIAQLLRINEMETGKLIHLDIEPEPGCILSSSSAVVSFFEDYLLPRGDRENILRYLRVCHDICHASTVFEDQEAAIGNYAASGIRIGKVHVSSAIEAEISGENWQPVFDQLKTFQEDRYLHQTYVKNCETIAGYDDLPRAIEDIDRRTEGTLRCHFHVPVFIEKFGHLGTTAHEIIDCLRNVYEISDCRDFEVETYAWTVLPDELRTEDLAKGIAEELLWTQEKVETIAESDTANGPTNSVR